MLRALLVIACAWALAGCAGPAATSTAEQGKPNLPPNYKALIAEHVKTTFFDPYSIRDASISTSADTYSIYGAVTNVCIRTNAKNRMGGYVGLTPTVYVFQAGVIVNTMTGEMASGCAGRSFEPFPEIESTALQQAPKR